MVVNEKMPPVLQRDCIRARIAVGQIDQRQLTPAFTAIVRPCFEEPRRFRTPDRLQASLRVNENARLNRLNVRVGFDLPCCRPRASTVATALEVNLPAPFLALLDTGRRKDVAIFQLDWLV